MITRPYSLQLTQADIGVGLIPGVEDASADHAAAVRRDAARVGDPSRAKQRHTRDALRYWPAVTMGIFFRIIVSLSSLVIKSLFSFESSFYVMRERGYSKADTGL